MNIYVANFDKDIKEEDLEHIFEKYGRVASVSIFGDWETGESRGFGFVEMPDEWEAERAIGKIDGRWWNGRRLKANKARTQNW
jgi:RNA recognition motif-containing protein